MSVKLTAAAEEDLTQIWIYTYQTWGFDQAEKYYDQIVFALKQLVPIKHGPKLLRVWWKIFMFMYARNIIFSSFPVSDRLFLQFCTAIWTLFGNSRVDFNSAQRDHCIAIDFLAFNF